MHATRYNTSDIHSNVKVCLPEYSRPIALIALRIIALRFNMAQMQGRDEDDDIVIVDEIMRLIGDGVGAQADDQFLEYLFPMMDGSLCDASAAGSTTCAEPSVEVEFPGAAGPGPAAVAAPPRACRRDPRGLCRTLAGQRSLGDRGRLRQRGWRARAAGVV